MALDKERFDRLLQRTISPMLRMSMLISKKDLKTFYRNLWKQKWMQP